MADLTVLLPVYNAEPYLQETLDSIRAQTYGDFELLCIDDGSTDRSAEIIRSCGDPRIRSLHNPRNLGLIETLNRGLREAGGRWVARQDADDLSHPQRLARQMAYLGRYPHVVLLGTQGIRIDGPGRKLGTMRRPTHAVSIRWYHLFDNAFIHTSTVFDRRRILDLGGYGDYRHCEDYELWSRVIDRYQVANLDDALVSRREHPESTISTLDGADVETNARVRRIRLRLAMDWLPDLKQPERAVDATDSIRRWSSSIGTPDAAYRALLSAYRHTYPQSENCRDFRRVVRRQNLQMARRRLPRHPVSAVRSAIAGIAG